ncbi:hypothetical protein BDN72DRAFT_904936 [Pluteus cervinus]|uniref:Uncharacterized protein n=1 Tax=Pluteus cervinus TaxID=181527 RepID=A0ACD3A586_9AGAR|nr:hypothetical protein BDN72DRAFT_904936 [Pluteus cervinus]
MTRPALLLNRIDPTKEGATFSVESHETRMGMYISRLRAACKALLEVYPVIEGADPWSRGPAEKIDWAANKFPIPENPSYFSHWMVCAVEELTQLLIEMSLVGMMSIFTPQVPRFVTEVLAFVRDYERQSYLPRPWTATLAQALACDTHDVTKIFPEYPHMWWKNVKIPDMLPFEWWLTDEVRDSYVNQLKTLPNPHETPAGLNGEVMHLIAKARTRLFRADTLLRRRKQHLEDAWRANRLSALSMLGFAHTIPYLVSGRLTSPKVRREESSLPPVSPSSDYDPAKNIDNTNLTRVRYDRCADEENFGPRIFNYLLSEPKPANKPVQFVDLTTDRDSPAPQPSTSLPVLGPALAGPAVPSDPASGQTVTISTFLPSTQSLALRGSHRDNPLPTLPPSGSSSSSQNRSGFVQTSEPSIPCPERGTALNEEDNFQGSNSEEDGVYDEDGYEVDEEGTEGTEGDHISIPSSYVSGDSLYLGSRPITPE